MLSLRSLIYLWYTLVLTTLPFTHDLQLLHSLKIKQGLVMMKFFHNKVHSLKAKIMLKLNNEQTYYSRHTSYCF